MSDRDWEQWQKGIKQESEKMTSNGALFHTERAWQRFACTERQESIDVKWLKDLVVGRKGR